MKENHRDTLVVAAIAGGCGIIVGAGLMGPWRSLSELLSKPWFYGWAAAWATAAVGFGAFKYAKEAHLLRESEVHENRMRQYRLDLAAYNEWRNRVISVGAGGDAYENLRAKMDLSVTPLRMHLTIVRNCISSIPPNGLATVHFAPTDSKILASVSALDGGSALLRVSCDAFLQRCAVLEVDLAPPPSFYGDFVDLMQTAITARDDCLKTAKMIAVLKPVEPIAPSIVGG